MLSVSGHTVATLDIPDLQTSCSSLPDIFLVCKRKMSMKFSGLLNTEPQPEEAKKDLAPGLTENEKRMSVVMAWEEYRKARAESEANQRLSDLVVWENQKKASLEAKMKLMEQTLEKKAAQHAEKLKNQVPKIQKQAKDKRAMVEAKKGKDLHKVEKVAEKFRTNGHAPDKPFGF